MIHSKISHKNQSEIRCDAAGRNICRQKCQETLSKYQFSLISTSPQQKKRKIRKARRILQWTQSGNCEEHDETFYFLVWMADVHTSDCRQRMATPMLCRRIKYIDIVSEKPRNLINIWEWLFLNLQIYIYVWYLRSQSL